MPIWGLVPAWPRGGPSLSRAFRVLLALALCNCLVLRAQDLDADSTLAKQPRRFQAASLIAPAILLGYGVAGLESPSLRSLNSQAQAEFREHAGERFSVDDISQYAPFLSVYGLNALGIKGRHSFRDRTLILGTAYLFMGITVNAIKRTSPVERPDGVGLNSFPSGHTATAFMGAEFLRQEYGDQSIWYGIGGYLVAAGTGFLRMYNDRHWLNDVAAGAGIGILSARIAYWIYPWVRDWLFGGESGPEGSLLPYYVPGEAGVQFVLRL